MTRERVAVLGGGIAGLTTAWELTRTEALRSRYEVTVYQLGWRLGGKLASGREGPEVRNVEHGLHVWFGFYDNAFNLLFELYDSWDKDPRNPFQRWEDVMKPRSYTPIGYQDEEERWQYFPQLWASTDEAPGGEDVNPSLWDVISGLLSAIENWFFHPEAGVARKRSAFAPPEHVLAVFREVIDVLADEEAEVRALAERGPLGSLFRALCRFIRDIERDVARFTVRHFNALRWLLRKISDEVEEEIAESTGSERMYWMFAEYAIAMLNGLLNPAYDILEDGDLNRINHLEFTAWMRENGCAEVVLDSTFMRVLYEAIFQYTDGDRRRPDMEAGTALRLILRLIFTYKGAVMYEVQGGMGDLLIAPLYEALTARGVRFEFFQRVERLELSDDKKNVERVRIRVQAETKAENGPYRPTFVVDYGPVWPSHPLWEQLEGGEAMKAAGVDFESKWEAWPPAGERVLERGTHFDAVVLAIALGAFKKLNDEDDTIVDELTAHAPKFDAMCQNLGLVPSQAVQLWMDRDLARLRFDYRRAGLAGELPALVNGPPPLDIWADMTQVLEVEQWRGNRPRSVHYFCGVYDTQLYKEPASRTDTGRRAAAEVRALGIAWLEAYTGYLWPGAARPGSWEVDWSTLHDDEGREGAARFDAQFVKANVDPTDCCVQSMTNTCQYRLAPGDSGFDNLYLAGTWTRTGVNASCVEGAVMSGMGAARAITGAPRRIIGWSWLQKW